MSKKNQVSFRGAKPTTARVIRIDVYGVETPCPDCRCPIKAKRGDLWCGCDMTEPWTSRLSEPIFDEGRGIDGHQFTYFERLVM